MYHVYYEHVRELHRHRHAIPESQMELQTSSPINTTLRSRSQLYLSDMLLNLGQRIRPAEFRGQILGGQAQNGTLEINAEGC
jgi:hypothetical protein